MLLLLVGALFAVESDPSAVVGYVKYDLVAGNNMIAIPMETTFTMASELGEDLGITTVSTWNNVLQIFESASYLDFLDTWDGDFAIDSGSVLMINAGAPGAFYSLGALPVTPSYPLLAGNNTIMIPLNRSDIAMASELGIEIGSNTISTWNNIAQLFESASYLDFLDTWDGDFATSIGDPLMVNVSTAGVFPGTQGRAINVKATVK